MIEISAWDKANPTEQEDIANHVLKRIEGFKWTGLNHFSLGGQSRSVAIFSRGEAQFAFVPGGTVELGYDRAKPPVMNAEMAEDWAGTEAEFEQTFTEYLDYWLMPHRRVVIPSMLVECDAQYFESEGEEPISEVEKKASIDGFRLPTVDEWEYLCSGGSRSLWRWGNECPTDDDSRGIQGWALHKVHNGFGIRMSWNVYAQEMCAGRFLRGGDGGESVCGGYGSVASFVPLMTSFTGPDLFDRNSAAGTHAVAKILGRSEREMLSKPPTTDTRGYWSDEFYDKYCIDSVDFRRVMTIK